MKKILAIGGAVIKTAKGELREYIENDQIEMLIHNGGSIFHDFQQAIDPNLTSHSYPLNDLINDYSCNKEASTYVWEFVNYNTAPEESITKLCVDKGIPVLLFTGLGCDFWHLFATPDLWSDYGRQSYYYFEELWKRFKDPFHYICMGSAVIHPEVFTKAIAVAKNKNFKSDVVDFKYMYRPQTRISIYGTYYHMTHKRFLGDQNALYKTRKKK
jgi:hypothetical protein